MNGKIIMNLAVSLDGFISDMDGGFDWIAGHGDISLDTESKHDFAAFLNTIDIVVMGRNCYDQGFAKDYPTKQVYVATSNPKADEENISFYSSIVEKVQEEQEKGKNIFLFGGGILVDHFMKANIIDEYIVGIIPIILGAGRPLFLGDNPEVKLHLDTYAVQDGIVVLHYRRRD